MQFRFSGFSAEVIGSVCDMLGPIIAFVTSVSSFRIKNWCYRFGLGLVWFDLKKNN